MLLLAMLSTIPQCKFPSLQTRVLRRKRHASTPQSSLSRTSTDLGKAVPPRPPHSWRSRKPCKGESKRTEGTSIMTHFIHSASMLLQKQTSFILSLHASAPQSVIHNDRPSAFFNVSLSTSIPDMLRALTRVRGPARERNAHPH
jgi:hypothetical protein